MKAYKTLLYVIALDVVVQAAAIGYAIFSVGRYLEAGGVLTKDTDVGSAGFAVHWLNAYVLVLLVLALVVTAILSQNRVAIKWAGVIFAALVIQFLMGMFSTDATWLGWFHGAGGFVIFTACTYTAWVALPRDAVLNRGGVV